MQGPETRPGLRSNGRLSRRRRGRNSGRASEARLIDVAYADYPGMTPRFLLPLSLSVSTILAAPGDVPQWRGPNRDGNFPETGLLKSWPSGGPKLAWKAEKLGKGMAGV